MEWIIGGIAAVILGVTGYVVGSIIGRDRAQRNREGAAATAEEVLGSARVEAQRMLSKADEEGRARAESYREREDASLEMRRVEIQVGEERLASRERTLEQRASNLAQREQFLIHREQEVAELRVEVEAQGEQARASLERVANLDVVAAKRELLEQVEADAKRDAMVLVRDTEIRAREEADRRARRILATAVQRLASEVVTETTVAIVELPSDDMKGRIIGREGRNIRAFEAVTGVNLIVDDTPEAVSVASFDPVRREVARIALEKLVADGRIHPASIEEAFEKASAEVEASVRDAGEWALLEVGISKMHPELVTLLGRLRYRTSYGQNVLNHLVESAHIGGMLAAELGLEPAPIKRASLLHDIGKAVTHEVEGSHALIGAEIARRFGEDPAIVHGIEAHHNEVEPRTLLAVIVQAADAVSAARPGARREALESYVRRLEKLENLVWDFEGVEKVFALQAGREVRVVVDPGRVDDLGAADLARRIAKRLEEDLQYPGQILVTVIRELRVTDYAR
jgi:ribonuclease Y